jgi:hypothetical protein
MVNDLASRASQTASMKNSQPKSTRHSCYCFQFNCKENIDGEGCFLCEQHRVLEVPAVKGGSNWCLWNCKICYCQCKCTFKQDKQTTIHAALKARAKQQIAKEQAYQGKLSKSASDNGEEVIFGCLQHHRNNAYQHQSLLKRRMEVFNESKEDAEYKFGAGFKENEESAVDNVESIAAMALFHDPSVCSNPNVSRALQKRIPITQDITVGNKTMSIAKMRKELCPWTEREGLTGGRVGEHQSAADCTPPQDNFMVNKNSGGRMHWNNLNKFLQKPVQSPSPPPEKELLIVRTQRRAYALTNDTTTTPSTKRKALLV